MQIVELELNHFNFYCPATGEYILVEDEPCNEDAASLMGYWVDEVIEEPFLKNQLLKKELEAFINDQEEQDEDFSFGFKELEQFLTEFKEPSWVVFKLTTCGIGCGGPMCNTVYLVIDMNTMTE
jgi:hypothetical protein